MNAKLTQAQERFAFLVVELENASAAYREAYPGSRAWKAKSVHEEASRLLATPKVASRVENLREAKRVEFEAEVRSRGITPEKVVAEQVLTAFFDPNDLFDDRGRLLPLPLMPEAARRAVKSIKVRQLRNAEGFVTDIQINDKLKALRDLGEHLGMYKQTHQRTRLDEIAAMSDDELEAEQLRLDEEIRRLTADSDKAVN